MRFAYYLVIVVLVGVTAIIPGTVFWMEWTLVRQAPERVPGVILLLELLRAAAPYLLLVSAIILSPRFHTTLVIFISFVGCMSAPLFTYAYCELSEIPLLWFGRMVPSLMFWAMTIPMFFWSIYPCRNFNPFMNWDNNTEFHVIKIILGFSLFGIGALTTLQSYSHLPSPKPDLYFSYRIQCLVFFFPYFSIAVGHFMTPRQGFHYTLFVLGVLLLLNGVWQAAISRPPIDQEAMILFGNQLYARNWGTVSLAVAWTIVPLWWLIWFLNLVEGQEEISSEPPSI